jgi:hypothetical protein
MYFCGFDFNLLHVPRSAARCRLLVSHLLSFGFLLIGWGPTASAAVPRPAAAAASAGAVLRLVV